MSFPGVMSARVTTMLTSNYMGALVGGGGGGHQINVRNAHRLRAGARIGTGRMRRDSNAGQGRVLDQCSGVRAALTGTSVPRGQGYEMV